MLTGKCLLKTSKFVCKKIKHALVNISCNCSHTLFSLFLSVRRLLKVATTPSTWLLSLWWLQTAPSGTQLSQSQKNSWSRCLLASSSSVKSRKPLTCQRACTSLTEGERLNGWDSSYSSSSPSLWLLIISSLLFSDTLLWSLRVACICLYSLCVRISYTHTHGLYIHIEPI